MYFFLDADKSISKLEKKYNKKLKNLSRKITLGGSQRESRVFPCLHRRKNYLTQITSVGHRRSIGP